MGPYRIILKPSVERDVCGLPANLIRRIFSAIERLKNEPFPSGVVKLEGAEKTFRIRVGDYRIVYEFASAEQMIEILYVRHRRDVYRKI